MKLNDLQSIKKITLIILFFIFLLIIFLIVLNSKPEQSKNPIQYPYEPSDISEITLDVSPEKVTSIIGNPTNQIKKNGFQVDQYETKSPGFYDETYKTDNKDTADIILIKEQVTSLKAIYLTDFSSNAPFDQNTRHTIEGGETNELYVFPESGVAFLAHFNDKRVFEIWRFKPTIMEEFDKNFESLLVEEENIHTRE